MQNPELFIDTFLIIFIGMGPIKALLIYISLTKDADPALKRKVAQKAVLTAATVGLLLLVAGAIFMRILHFTTSALTIAGGLILLLLALNMVLSPAHKPDPDATLDEETVLSKAIYPLGIPLLLNPVGIVALTVLSSQTEGDWLMGGVVAVMVLVVAAIDFGIFLGSDRLGKYLTHERILVLEKLLGILLSALAVQMILNGLAELGIITMSGGH